MRIRTSTISMLLLLILILIIPFTSIAQDKERNSISTLEEMVELSHADIMMLSKLFGISVSTEGFEMKLEDYTVYQFQVSALLGALYDIQSLHPDKRIDFKFSNVLIKVVALNGGISYSEGEKRLTIEVDEDTFPKWGVDNLGYSLTVLLDLCESDDGENLNRAGLAAVCFFDLITSTELKEFLQVNNLYSLKDKD